MLELYAVIIIKTVTGVAACAGAKAEERVGCEWEPKAQGGGFRRGFPAEETAGGSSPEGRCVRE